MWLIAHARVSYHEKTNVLFARLFSQATSQMKNPQQNFWAKLKTNVQVFSVSKCFHKTRVVLLKWWRHVITWLTLLWSSTTTMCLRPRALNRRKTRGNEELCRNKYSTLILLQFSELLRKMVYHPCSPTRHAVQTKYSRSLPNLSFCLFEFVRGFSFITVWGVGNIGGVTLFSEAI